MTVDFNDKRFRTEFSSERKRVLAAIKDCEDLDKSLSAMKANLEGSMARVRGAASQVIRLTEQIISNRNQRLALVKELRAMTKDVVDREIRLGMNTQEQVNVENSNAINAALFAKMQSMTLIQGGVSSILDPISVGEFAAAAGNVNTPQQAPVAGTKPVSKKKTTKVEKAPEPLPVEEPETEEHGLPEIRPGDIVSDAKGHIWIIGDDNSLEDAGIDADEVILERSDGGPAYAVLSDGRTVYVVDID